jgi:hypothetical protein
MKRVLASAAILIVCLIALFHCCETALADGEEALPGTGQSPSEQPPGAGKETDKDQPVAKRELEQPWNTVPARTLGVLFESLADIVGNNILADKGFRYEPYPYFKEHYAYSDPKSEIRGAPGVARLTYQRVSAHHYSLSLEGALRMSSGFDLSASGTVYDEKTRLDKHERTRFSRVRLSYLVSPLPGNILIRPGAGAAFLDTRSGLDIGLEIECFPQKPFLFRASVGHTFITNHHGVTEINIGIGVLWGPMEFCLGYRGLVLREETIDGAYVTIGFWF